ncbi:MAG TPA: dihydroneopterin aldolase [Armatimonadota bacterium]|nr:dihydroneopterin aldolase [Armatimonadota bacterium]
MSDRIRIEGIEFYGFHGVPAAEREIGHRYRVDLELELDLHEAGETDDVERTVDYGAVAQRIVEIGTGPSVQLVETLAERMAARVLAGFPRVEAVTMRVAKLHPPVPVHFAASVIEIRRVRAEG